MRQLEPMLVRPAPGSRLRRRLWREACFLRALARRFRLGAAIVLVLFAAAVGCFMALGAEADRPLGAAAWRAWTLLLGDLPERPPADRVLLAVSIVLPLAGLLALAQGFIEFFVMLTDRRHNERGWSEIMAESSSDHVVLVGLGKLGYRCWLLLERLGEKVVVIERDPRAQFLDEVRHAGTPLLVGDGRSDEMLMAANVAKARSIVLATDDDLANLEMALDARRMNPQVRVILRMFDQQMANKVREGFDIGHAMSQSSLSAPAFAMAAHDPSIVRTFSLDGELFVLQRWSVRPGGPLDGHAVAAVRTELGFAVVQHVRDGGAPAYHPTGDTVLRAGDTLIVEGRFETLQQLRARGVAAKLALAKPRAAPVA